MTLPDRTNQTTTLADGRKLGFAEYGPSWGFQPAEIRAKTFVWQGEADPNVPPVMGRYFAETIPDCAASFVPGAGHMLFYTHFAAILQQAADYAQSL